LSHYIFESYTVIILFLYKPSPHEHRIILPLYFAHTFAPIICPYICPYILPIHLPLYFASQTPHTCATNTAYLCHKHRILVPRPPHTCATNTAYVCHDHRILVPRTPHTCAPIFCLYIRSLLSHYITSVYPLSSRTPQRTPGLPVSVGLF